MPLLNYMAIMCEDPEHLRDYYCRWFGLEELNRTPTGSIYLTDGHFTMALLKKGSAPGEENQQKGLHHFGFQIESIAEIEQRLEDFDASIRLEKRPPEDPYAEYRIRDPLGIPIDLSEKGYGVKGEPRIPGIRHVATMGEDIPRRFAFYKQVLGMRDVTRTDEEIARHIEMSLGEAPKEVQHSTSRFGGDGYINLAILPWNEASGRKRGFEHFGFLVGDPRHMMYSINAAETLTRLDVRPADRFAEYRIFDPEGNGADLSERKGYNVDVGKVVRIGD